MNSVFLVQVEAVDDTQDKPRKREVLAQGLVGKAVQRLSAGFTNQRQIGLGQVGDRTLDESLVIFDLEERRAFFDLTSHIRDPLLSDFAFFSFPGLPTPRVLFLPSPLV